MKFMDKLIQDANELVRLATENRKQAMYQVENPTKIEQLLNLVNYESNR